MIKKKTKLDYVKTKGKKKEEKNRWDREISLNIA